MNAGKAYRLLVAKYIVDNFGGGQGDQALRVFMEVPFGRSVIGKKRRLDILVLRTSDQRALAIECKWQNFKGTTDEKIHYALADIVALPIPGCVVYAGEGWSAGILHTLAASPVAAFCLPQANCARSDATLELDYVLAATFGLWDKVIKAVRVYKEADGLAAIDYWHHPERRTQGDDEEEDEEDEAGA
jgi:hypothetical protein